MHNNELNIIYEDKYLIVVNKDYNQEINLDSFYPLNSLSKETSGIVVFSKNKYKVKCTYLGIVEGYLDAYENNIQVIKSSEKYSIIEYTTLSNDLDLREYLMKLNHPVIGDYKYKSEINPIKRICLHLKKVEIDNKTIFSSIPDSFKIFMP